MTKLQFRNARVLEIRAPGQRWTYHYYAYDVSRYFAVVDTLHPRPGTRLFSVIHRPTGRWALNWLPLAKAKRAHVDFARAARRHPKAWAFTNAKRIPAIVKQDGTRIKAKFFPAVTP